MTGRDDTTAGTRVSEQPASGLGSSATATGVEGNSGGGDERPEIFVAGAFLGGLVAALVLKRVARG